ITGDLTIKNITKPISFPAVVTNNDGQLKLIADIKLDRTLWDIRYGSDKFFDNLANNVIDDIFTVTLNLTAAKQ
ncbi:MAG: YceI family protein, partial [Patescibacteria group bacterium]